MPTKIEWTDETWNPVTGCTPISDGCKNCYAKRMAQRLRGRYGYPANNPFRVTFHPDRLEQPLKWRKPRRIFVCSMGDIFHAHLSDNRIFRVFDIALRAHRHTYIFLTKRPERALRTIQAYVDDWNMKALPDNFWVGVTAENQETADERIPILQQIPAAVKFVSVEPMLARIDLFDFVSPLSSRFQQSLSWGICGFETGPKARPCKIEWIEDLKDQCVNAGVPFFYKNNEGRLSDGVYRQFPGD